MIKKIDKEKLVLTCIDLLFLFFFAMIIIPKIAVAFHIAYCTWMADAPWILYCERPGDYAAGVTSFAFPSRGAESYCEIEDCVRAVDSYYCDWPDHNCLTQYGGADYVDRFIRCNEQNIFVKVVNAERDAAGLDFCPNYTMIWGDDGNGKFCSVYCSYNPSNRYDGVWDGSEQKCIKCDYFNVEVSLLGDTNDIYCPHPSQTPGNQKCESACGASQECDEQPINFPHRHTSYPHIDVLCDSSCQDIWCYGNSCEQVVVFGISWTCVYAWTYPPDSPDSPDYPAYPTYYPPYAIWMWLRTNFINSTGYELEDGVPWQECFDNIDNDCDGLKDCADPDCKGVQNPNTGVRCCQSDSDCPGYDPITRTKYVCECPDLSKCNITGSSYTCKPLPRCYTNIDCEDGWCCDRDPSLPDECKGEGSCVKKGSTTTKCNNRYLCDPPNEFVSFSNKKVSLLDLLINPFFKVFS